MNLAGPLTGDHVVTGCVYPRLEGGGQSPRVDAPRRVLEDCMLWILTSLVSNVAIVLTEYYNRTSGGLVDALSQTWPLIVVAQVGLFYSWNGAPHWMYAWLVFAIGNTAMRLAMVHITGQPIGSWPLVLAGVSCILGGSFIVKQGLH